MSAHATVRLDIALQPKQMRLLNAIRDRRPDAPTVLGFGGSRGAAKSGGVRRIALILATEQPCIIWIIRRVWDDLNKDHVQPLFKEYPQFKDFWRATEKVVQFPNGSSLYFIHAGDTGRAKRKARGPQAHYIFLEQAEEFTQAEMEQLAGSNRAPGVPSGFCKRIYTFNPGGVGTNYLRRIFHLREYRDNEDAREFMFIQGFGWDNYEWFRGLGLVDEWEFYNDPEWSDQKRFDVFIHHTDFGRKLNALPQKDRIGELMGSFDKFSGQYFSEVWEEKATVLPAEMVNRIIQPWWRRWIATDWGFSHYAATGWFASGVLSEGQVRELFGVTATGSVRVILMYRELVCCDVAEPDLARLIISMTPVAERREIRDHWMGHDAWAKRGSAKTVVEQMEPILARDGLQRLSQADIDRVGGWRLLYNAWASARRLRLWGGTEPFVDRAEDTPAFFVSAACPEVLSGIPMLICDDDNPQDVRKMAGDVADDVADMIRYGLKSYLSAEPGVPKEIDRAETYGRYEDPTARAMAMLKLSAEHDRGQYIRRRRRA
jgi:phage terminase large subunit